jgi:hypothetical protein
MYDVIMENPAENYKRATPEFTDLSKEANELWEAYMHEKASEIARKLDNPADLGGEISKENYEAVKEALDDQILISMLRERLKGGVLSADMLPKEIIESMEQRIKDRNEKI